MTTRKKVSKNENPIKTTREKVGKNKKRIMTTKKKVSGNESRINQTDHQRAMTNPKVRESLMGLQNCWSLLTQRELGGQLNALIRFNCSVRGLAKELGKSETSIRRLMKLAKQPEEDSEGITVRESTSAAVPKRPSTVSTGEAVRHFPSKIPAKKIVEPVIREVSPAQDHAHASTAEQTKKIPSPLSTTVKKLPVVDGRMSRQEGQEKAPRQGAKVKTFTKSWHDWPQCLIKLSRDQSPSTKSTQERWGGRVNQCRQKILKNPSPKLRRAF